MSSISHFTTTLKLLSDPARLRVLAILEGNELTVKELTAVLHLGQSTLSSQLAQLKDQGLVTFRREGQYVFYRIPRHSSNSLEGKLLRTVREIVPEAEWYERDRRTLKKIMDERQEASLSYFREQKTQNQRSPGQGWESVATAFLLTLRNLQVVDLGCGSGRLAALIARAGNSVVGVDNSPEQIRLATQIHDSETSPLRGTLSFLSAPMENTGLEASQFDLAIISHALHHVPRPLDALSEAQRILKPGGQILVLDLASHQEDWIQERFGDFWLGFGEDILTDWMHEAGFADIRFEISGRDLEYPAIEALVLSGIKPL